MEDKLMKN